MVCDVLPFSQDKRKHFTYNFFGFASPFAIKILPQEVESYLSPPRMAFPR